MHLFSSLSTFQTLHIFTSAHSKGSCNEDIKEGKDENTENKEENQIIVKDKRDIEGRN
jgi:hypothetical protein